MRHKIGSTEEGRYKARCALVDEQIAAGLTSPTEIANKLKKSEFFQGLNHSAVVCH